MKLRRVLYPNIVIIFFSMQNILSQKHEWKCKVKVVFGFPALPEGSVRPFCVSLFSGLAYNFFSDFFCMKSGFNNHKKVMKLLKLFWENSFYAQNGVNGVLGPDINTWTLWNCTWWQPEKFLRKFSQENLIMSKIWKMGHFWVQNQHFWTFR